MRISRLGFLLFFGVVAISAAWFLTPTRNQTGRGKQAADSKNSTPLSAKSTPGAVPILPRTTRYVGDDEDLGDGNDTESSKYESPLSRRSIFARSTPAPRVPPQGRVSSELRDIEDGPSIRTNIFDDISRAGENRNGRDRLFGLRSGSGSVTGASSTDGLQSDVTGEELNRVRQRVGGQARGYSMLYLMNQRARPVVEQQIATLLRAEISNMHIGVLVDGTFGQDYNYLRQVITRLNTGDRTLLLTLYLVSGPTMRDFDRTPIRTVFSQIEPLRFRSLITSDRRVRSQFVRIAREARQAFELNRSLNELNRNIAVVMLEDNLDRSSYRAMRSLAAGALGDLVQFVRNPCLGCFTGNDLESFGDAREEHTIEGFDRLGTNDGFSLDGTSFNYPGEPPSPGPSASDLAIIMDQALARGLDYVGLWRFNWQGIQPANGLPSPDERVYIPSTFNEQEFEISMLRRGLVPVIPTPTPNAIEQ